MVDREFNTLRARMACGLGGSKKFTVTCLVIELVGWEHSLKNELIIAKYTGHKKRNASERLRAILAQFGIESLLETRFRLEDSPG